MSARKLADELQSGISIHRLTSLNDEAANLLRHQADQLDSQAEVVATQSARIIELEKAIMEALDLVSPADKEKPYFDPDMHGEIVEIRLSGLCLLAKAIGKRDGEKIMQEQMRHQQVAPKEVAKAIDEALGIDR